jgi:LysM repeat protein
VTAEHRCELRPDEVPGPGHQLAYCLTPNHVSCPQLRSYEAARHAAAQEERARTSPLAPAGAPGFGARAVPEQAAASRIPMRQAPRERTMLSRFAWATAGAVGALALVGMLAFAYAPDRVASEPAEVPTASPTADVTAQATGDDVGLTGTVVVGSEATDEASPTPLATPEPPRTYIVQPGDTLAAIAREFETSVTALVEVNGIADGRLISIGDELLIPGAEPEAATTE